MHACSIPFFKFGYRLCMYTGRHSFRFCTNPYSQNNEPTSLFLCRRLAVIRISVTDVHAAVVAAVLAPAVAVLAPAVALVVVLVVVPCFFILPTLSNAFFTRFLFSCGIA